MSKKKKGLTLWQDWVKSDISNTDVLKKQKTYLPPLYISLVVFTEHALNQIAVYLPWNISHKPARS